jgi:O-antigen/teichoic acid export membrane protein
MTAVHLTNRLTSFRMNDFVVKYLSEALVREDRPLGGAIFKAGLLTETASSILAFLILLAAGRPIAALFLDDRQAAALLWLYGLVILGNAVEESTRGALQVFDRFAREAMLRVVRRSLILLGVAVAYWRGGGLAAVLVANVVGLSVVGAAQAWLAGREASRRIGPDWWRQPLSHLGDRRRELARFAVATNLSATAGLIVKESDLLWVSLFRAPAEAGYYHLARSLLKIPFAAVSPLATVIYPELARTLGRGLIGGTRRLLRQGSAIAAAWVAPVTVALAILAPWIIRRFYGAEFLPAVPALWLLLPGLALANVLFWTRPTLLALGRPDVALRISLLHAGLKVVLAISLVPVWGYLALAGTLSGLYIVGLGLALAFILPELRRLDAATPGPLRNGPGGPP